MSLTHRINDACMIKYDGKTHYFFGGINGKQISDADEIVQIIIQGDWCMITGIKGRRVGRPGTCRFDHSPEEMIDDLWSRLSEEFNVVSSYSNFMLNLIKKTATPF